MTTPTLKIHPSAPLENDDLQQRLEKKLNVVNSFKNHINKIKKMMTYFTDKKTNQKRNIEIIKL